MDNEIGKRIKKIRKDSGYSQREFAEILGLKDPVTISRWENGYRKPEYNILGKLVEIFNVNLHWLLTGKGEESFLSNPNMNLDNNLEEYGFIPIFEISASAGGGYINNENEISDYMLFKKEWLVSKISSDLSSLVIITVEGDSMEPTLQAGDLIMVDKTYSYVEKEGIYVILYDELLMVKRAQLIIESGMEKIKLISDNKLYESFTIPVSEDENINIIGKVVWYGRKI